MYAGRLAVLAIDAGPTWMGWCLLDVQHGPGIRTTFVRGGHEPCDHAAFSARFGGEMADAASLNTELVLVVETPMGFAFQPSRVPTLLTTAVAAGGMLWMAKSRGIRTVSASAQMVRKVLAGKQNADDDDVRRMVESNVFGAGGATNDHARDAVAVGLLGAWVLVGQVVLPDPPAVKSRKKKGGGEDGGKRATKRSKSRGRSDGEASA